MEQSRLSGSTASGGDSQPDPPALTDFAVDHQCAVLDGKDLGTAQETLRPVEGSTIDTLLHLPYLSPKPTEQNSVRFDVFFLPDIYNDDPTRNPAKHPMLLDDLDLCKALTQTLRLKPFFLTKDGWDSNGFMSIQQSSNVEGFEIHNYATRFLIKFLRFPDSDDQLPYSWLFLSFSIVWVKCRNGKISCVLVCFDDTPKIKGKILAALQQHLGKLKDSPFAIYDALLSLVIWQYDTALWKFRKPVRDFEKNRDQFVKKLPTLLLENPGDDHGIMKDYENMHEMSRHAIHMSETLEAAAKTVKSTLRHIEHATSGDNNPSTLNVTAGIQFAASFLANLMLRSDAFSERIQNEIRLAFNVVSVSQLKNTQRLLEESRVEGQDLIQFVTLLSLIFLPLSFVTGFWGMNFISMEEDKQGLFFSHDFWKFGVSSGVALLFSLLPWFLFHYVGWRPSLQGFGLLNTTSKRRTRLQRTRGRTV